MDDDYDLNYFRKMFFNKNIYLVDCRSHTSFVNGVVESTYAVPEKTKRGPPTNKNIPVRNMKAQIANMSLNENAGFKNEYHVRFFCCLISF